jgi:hypothetical protein
MGVEERDGSSAMAAGSSLPAQVARAGAARDDG